MPESRRKHIRLAAETYRVKGQVFSVTIGINSREPVFANQALGLDCVQILRDLRSNLGNPLYAYCLMPDHVHLLIGISENGSLSDFVGRWKSLCYQARCNRGNRDRFWQKGYFDHALRAEEALKAVVRYILLNPVRKGLVKDFRLYPLCGSLEWDVTEWSSL